MICVWAASPDEAELASGPHTKLDATEIGTTHLIYADTILATL